MGPMCSPLYQAHTIESTLVYCLQLFKRSSEGVGRALSAPRYALTSHKSSLRLGGGGKGLIACVQTHIAIVCSVHC